MADYCSSLTYEYLVLDSKLDNFLHLHFPSENKNYTLN